MGGDDLLDFSSRTFGEFVADSTGRDIYDASYDYASGSKTNRLRAFWTREANQLVGKLIAELVTYSRPAAGDSGGDRLFEECERIATQRVQRAR